MVSESNIYKKNDHEAWLRRTYLVLASVTIIASAFHFWPFQQSRMWQMLNFTNLACILSVIAAACFAMTGKVRHCFRHALPHISVFAYLVINLLSIAFANEFSRSAGFTVKLVLVLVGGFTMFSLAAANERVLKTLYRLVVVAASISVAYCLFARFVQNTGYFGFHVNPHKYGTYIGILASLSGAYLLSSHGKMQMIFGLALIVAACVSAGTVGTVIAIICGLLTMLAFVKNRMARMSVIVTLILSIIALVALPNCSKALLADMRLTEEDGKNLKQRYIEWQAEINLLQERGVTGTGAGCVNDYRSFFYYRLPKLNTLNSFDQNGWLATAAETGIIGLAAFCCIIGYYGRMAIRLLVKLRHSREQTGYRLAVCNLVGLIAACIANLFSSVNYNGIMIVFVLVLAFISATDRIYGKLCE